MRLPIIGMAMVLLLWVGIGPSQAQTLKNPGFETASKPLVSGSDAPNAKARIVGTIADGWLDNTNWADVDLVYSMDSAHPHASRSAQKIEIRRGFAQLVQDRRLPRGFYRISVWLRAEAPMWVTLGLRQTDKPYSSYAAQPARIGSRWTRVETSGFVPHDMVTYFLICTEAIGTLYVDDAELGRAHAHAVTLHPPTGAIPKAFFGLNINHMHDGGNIPWPSVPFGTYRTWDSGVVWALVEPKRGEFDWSRLDKDVAAAEKHGVQVLLTLGFTPNWASSDPNNKTSPYGALGATAPPADIRDWKDFVRAVATRYRGRVRAYEVWNEPDSPDFYSGTPAHLVPLERAMVAVLREADPAAIAVAPAPSSGDNIVTLKWMRAYLAAGGCRYADVLAVHLYAASPEDDIKAAAVFRGVLSEYRMDAKPLWNTETGWGFDGKGTDEEISAYVVRAVVLNWACRLSRFCWYSWSEVSLVGIRPDAQGRYVSLTPAAIAFDQAYRWLLGSKMASCGMDERGVWTAALLQPGGGRAWIMWAMGDPQSVAVSASWRVKQTCDIAGRKTPLGGNTIMVGNAPILLMTSSK